MNTSRRSLYKHLFNLSQYLTARQPTSKYISKFADKERSLYKGIPVAFEAETRKRLKAMGFSSVRIRYRGPRPNIDCYKGLVRRQDCKKETATSFAVYLG